MIQQLADFTRVFINRKTGKARIIPNAPKVKPEENETEVNGVIAAQLNFTTDNAVKMELVLWADFDKNGIEGTPSYYVIDPTTGISEKVKKIEFENGTEWPIK